MRKDRRPPDLDGPENLRPPRFLDSFEDTTRSPQSQANLGGDLLMKLEIILALLELARAIISLMIELVK